ncbi:MAG: acyltransferase family protein [Proteobacteria bacterium]|nr:acyltransferase family protein [Pseudomonadota bacterium]
MKAFFGKAVKKALDASGLSKEDLAYKVLPHFLLEIFTKYLRVNTGGESFVPKKGAVIFVANHSGFMGFDALMIGHQIYLKSRRVPRIIAHKLWFLRPEISVHAKKLGLIPATIENGLKILKKGQGLILFPEGEEGNFKPTKYRYRLQRFRRGFVRLALQTGAPIIPVAVIGAEETNITLSQIRWAKQLLGIIIPVPLNVIPLPARWHIQFMEPIYLGKDEAKANDMEYVTKISRQIRLKLQKELHSQLKKRDRVFL